MIQTRAYQARIEKLPVTPICRECRGAPETIGHILSNCPRKLWNQYKMRHDKVLRQLVLQLDRKYNISVPQNIKWGESGLQIAEILEGKEVKMAVDFSIPTDRQITERRPDLVLYLKKERRIVMTEVACAWEPLILEREEDKGSKYGELFS